MEGKKAFQGNVALVLETLTNNYMKNEQCNVEVTANMIANGSFASIMIFLLCYKYGRTKDVIEFSTDASKYLGLSAREIPLSEAFIIFERFKTIFDEKF